MDAYILAAGRGSRMNNLTDHKPKCFATLGSIPLIKHQTNSLFSGGVTSLTVITGYKSEVFSCLPYPTIYNNLWSSTNMISSLNLALKDSSSTFLVSYSDIVYSSEVVSSLCSSSDQYDIVLAYDPRWLQLWSKRFSDPLIDAESFAFDASNLLIDIGRRLDTLDPIMGQFIGLFKVNSHFTPKLLDILSGNDALINKYDTTMLLNFLIGLGCKIRCIPIRSCWCEIDSKSDLALAEAMLAEGKLLSFHD